VPFFVLPCRELAIFIFLLKRYPGFVPLDSGIGLALARPMSGLMKEKKKRKGREIE